MTTFDCIYITSTSVWNISFEFSQKIAIKTRSTICWISTSLTRRNFIEAKFTFFSLINKILVVTFWAISEWIANFAMSSWNWITRSTSRVPISKIFTCLTFFKNPETRLTLIRNLIYIYNFIFTTKRTCIDIRTT